MAIRIEKDDIIRLLNNSSVASELVAQVTGLWDNGTPFTIPITDTSGATRVNASKDSAPVPLSGWIHGANVSTPSTIKRGRTYIILHTVRNDLTVNVLGQGYVASDIDVILGQYTEPGPGGGEGFLSWVEIFHDRAGNAAAFGDVSLAATNAYRKVYGLAWYYFSSSDVATRTFNAPSLQNLGGATPTGFVTTADNAIFWNTGANISLTADQEGAHISVSYKGKDGRTVTNDSGVQTIASTAGAPTPWPLLVTEDELGIIRFPAITSGEAADTHSAYILIEEWIWP